jgi:F0F1-type ATP synthase assembly protein I
MVRRACAPAMLAFTHFTAAMTDRDEHQHDRRSDKSAHRDHSWQRGFANAWMVLGAVPAGLFLGYLIDDAAETTPTWMLVLSLLFLSVSLYRLVKDNRK